MAIRVKVCTPDLRNEVVEGVCLDENEQIETEVYHIHPRQVSAVCDLPTQKAEESLEINQSFDEKEILVKCKEDKITFSVLLPMMKQYWKYNLRIKRNGTWGTTEGKQRNKYIDFEFELLTAVYVVVTSTTLAQSINLFPTETLDYTFAENDEIKLHCPKGAVKEQEQIDVWVSI
ncbi:hypothetical protein KP79_PYT03412 [Mizuhopecten yessoensis]|uniref:Uncharacterized protein n=2 Tax=Mizuhopecten yessoensis TaxID=6573 RepID=A0A210PDE2_MIZYE|nr:hypothetical protein KP79_PYT03412 [Mizuhopecten yessoensis]